MNENLFHNFTRYEKDKEELFKYWNRSNEKFKKHFQITYIENPPSWMIFETSSFGNLSKIYENINKSEYKEIIAKHFGFKKHSEHVLISWFRHLVSIRNIIAHYGRLFSRHFTTKPIISKDKKEILGINLIPDKIFTSIIIIVYLLKMSNNNHINFINETILLLSKYKTLNIHFMGFPDCWQNTPILKIK